MIYTYTHNYPSDISREQFELIRRDLENSKKKTRPSQIDLYDVFCAVLYVLKGGIQWRMLPHDFPNWQSVYYHYRNWSKVNTDGVSLLDTVLKKSGEIITKQRTESRQTNLGNN